MEIHLRQSLTENANLPQLDKVAEECITEQGRGTI